jgi:hypothetical protein
MSVDGFSTNDGWTIHFERLLVGLGNISLEGDACNDYANAGYDRLFDFTRPGTEKLGEVYGLGGCDIQFRIRSPSTDTLLENGTTAADREFMRDFGNVGPLPMGVPLPRTVAYLRGVATRSNETKRFDWKFAGRISLAHCIGGANTSETSFVQLKAGDDFRSKISFHGEGLFREGIDDNAALRFDPLAGADANGDGDITLEEIAKLPAPVVEMDGGVADAGPAEPSTTSLVGFAGFMATELLPRSAYFDGSPCKLLVQRRGGGGF